MKFTSGIRLRNTWQKLGRLVAKATIWHWLLAMMAALTISILLGSSSGLLYGLQQNKAAREGQLTVELMVQMNLAQMDMDAGRYTLARQRYEFVIGEDPDYTGVQEKLVEAMIGQTANVVVVPTVEAVPTATPDTRAAGELYAAAQAHQANQEWSSLLDALVALRSADPNYEVVQVDRMLNLALRMRAAEKILNEGNLEGGLYDLTLAEGFAPLDTKSNLWREWARLYLIGASFWNVNPEQAVSYFSQLLLTAPYLRDLTGLTVTDRYRQSLIQYGDKLAAAGDWCAAQVQYDAALSVSAAESEAAVKAQQAVEECANPFGTATATMQVTQGVVGTPTVTLSPLATQSTITLTPDPALQTPTPTATTPAAVSSPTVENTPGAIATTVTPSAEAPTQETPPATTP